MKLIVGDVGLYDGWWSNGDYNWEKADPKASNPNSKSRTSPSHVQTQASASAAVVLRGTHNAASSKGVISQSNSPSN